MRPVRLTVQAFGPYPGRVVIDFRNAVEAGLFGIYGQTGSGKSTIFSAMTFALFGEPTKSEQEAHSLRSDHADPNLMTEAEFVFDIGDRRYVVLRRPEQIRLKNRGDGETRSMHEAYLFDATGMSPDEITDMARGKIIAEKKVREVDATILAMLGYGAQQFRQIVLLPQGRFEKFLSAKTKERLEILRELFDVSTYEALMAVLKTEAEAAERQVREERALYQRQLSTEGFESADALSAGIEVETARFAELQAAEEGARATAEAAGRRLREAEAIEEKFATAESTKGTLDRLVAQQMGIEVLGAQVKRAEHARLLIDAEERVRDAEREVSDAETLLREATEAAELAAKRAKDAADALRREEQRSEEFESLRRRQDELERVQRIFEASTGSSEAFKAASKAQQEAFYALEKGKAEVTRVHGAHAAAIAKLKAARETATQRHATSGRRAALEAQFLAANTYEAALGDLQSAQREVSKQLTITEAATAKAEMAQMNLEAAEGNLATAQALHLAMKLEVGSPCPVCGAKEHPSPATGEIGNAGLDKAFRDARDAWQAADRASRLANETLAGLQATLRERESRLSELERPEQSSESLAKNLEREVEALKTLGPDVDIGAVEADVEEVNLRIDTLERQRDELRDRFEECRIEATEARTVYESKLAEVPQDLRDPPVLAAAVQNVSGALGDLVAKRAAAERAQRATSDATLSANKDLESARMVLAACEERCQKATDAFRNRLDSTGLTEDVFQSMKPAIETLDEDREKVETYWREHKSAADAATKAASQIEELSRPDLASLRNSLEALTNMLGEATEMRIGAKGRIDHLTRLRTGLEAAFRKLDEVEVASRPLRILAALVNGQNAQRLTLETFAIGAMFDRVLDAANMRLSPMTSGRYRFERDLEGAGRGSRGLGIQVFDVHTGKSRTTSTLSGGETFIAALALALGLADAVESASGKVRLDTIFIDEGFGSLDTESGSGTLDQVLQVLSSLVRQNRAVGLISHVPLVQEAIPNGFYIRKGISGSSVEERSLG